MLLEPHSHIHVVGEAGTGRAAVELIAELGPDLVFLDIQMPDLDGFEVIETLPEEVSPAIIFVTAFDEYAVRAFEAAAVDYLLKPLKRERFDASVRRVEALVRDRGGAAPDLVPLLEARRSRLASERSTYTQRVTVPTTEGHKVLRVAQVDWIEAQDYYAALHSGEETYLAKVSLTSLASELDPGTFVRVHRSTIVNLDAVDLVETSDSDPACVLLKGGTRRRVSRSGLRALQAALKMLR